MTVGRRWVSCVLMALLLTGCWDRREIEEWSTSLATGVDVCAEGQNCRLIATRSIAIPGRAQVGSGAEGGGGGDGKGQEKVFVLSTPGDSGPDTVRRAQASLNRRIFFGHARIFVFSEAYCRRGMADYLDYMRRSPGFRRQMWIAVSEGTAEEVIRANPPLQPVPALFLSEMMEDAAQNGRAPRIFFGEFLTRLSNKGEEPVAPVIRMLGPDQPSLSGLAVFRGDQMVGKLNMAETFSLMEVRGLRRGAERIDVDLPNGGRAVLSVFGRKSRQQVSWDGRRVNDHVDIEFEAELAQVSPGVRGSDPEVLRAIERRTGEIVKGRAEAVLSKLQQEFRSDALGLGERVRAEMPDVWASIRDWATAFEQSRINVTANVRVRRGGVSAD